jgi:hypothetical protein
MTEERKTDRVAQKALGRLIRYPDRSFESFPALLAPDSPPLTRQHGFDPDFLKDFKRVVGREAVMPQPPPVPTQRRGTQSI